MIGCRLLQFLLNDRRQRIEDALLLALVEHAGQHVAETRLANAGSDVLPAVRGQHLGMDARCFGGVEHAAANGAEVIDIRLGLLLQHAVDAGHKRNQIVDGRIALARR